MFDGLRDLNARIDRDNLRVHRPRHIIFLCGGIIAQDANEKSAMSVRDYLYRVRQAEKHLNFTIVLAETAQQLYRDTTYEDLISFEEDIAKIASIVLVISESPGSLAELGAFSSEPEIRDALRIIISEDHNSAESFVRYGPIKRIENIKRSNIGIFPWKNHRSSGHIVKASIKPHYKEMVKFIKDNVQAIPDSFSYSLIPKKAIFFDLVWILSLLEAVPPEPLYEAVRLIHPSLSDSDIRNCLYALRVCRWINVFSYSGRDFYYLPENHDPYEYAFAPGMRVRDVPAKKLEVVAEFQRDAGIGKAIIRRLIEKRRGLA